MKDDEGNVLVLLENPAHFGADAALSVHLVFVVVGVDEGLPVVRMRTMKNVGHGGLGVHFE